MTDFLLLEELHRMIKEIPKPRLMFRKGVSAGGFFRPYLSFAEYTKASIFRNLDEITPVTVRFSSMLGDQGTADTVRNVKEMDVKFKASEGNYDMLCQSLPVFFIDEEDKIAGFLKQFGEKQGFDRMDRNAFWRFVMENPEAANGIIRLFSGEGLSDSFIHMTWYSVNNVLWSSDAGESLLVRYKWIPLPEEEEREDFSKRKLNRNYAEFMAGFDPDTAVDDLCRRMERGQFPAYELYIQMADPEDAGCLKRTLIWNEAAHPYISAGVMKLTRILQDRRESELLSFAPGNTIDGISLYRDGFSDLADHIYRLEALERGGRI